jgi:hypothetical protein
MTAASVDDLFDQDWDRIMRLDPADPRVADVSAERPSDDFYDLGDEDLASVPPEVLEDFVSDPFTGEGEAFAAGFLHHEGGRRGRGFAAGGILDEMDAGPLLAQFLAEAGTDFRQLAGLSDSALIGYLYATERLISRYCGLRSEALITLALRRAAQSAELKNKHLLEHVDGEIAAALHIQRRPATSLLDHSGLLRRLPDVRAAQVRGRITWEKAEIFGDELAALTAEQAQEIAAKVLPVAEAMTPEELRRLLRLLVEQTDPDAVRSRRKKARKDTAVHLWTEPSGNCGLAGRELDPALAHAADARLTAQAQWLAQHGMHGTLDQLRAAAFLANQNGVPLAALLRDAGDSEQPTGTSSTTPNTDAPSGATSTDDAGTGSKAGGGGKPSPTGPDTTGHDGNARSTGPDSTSSGQGGKPGTTGPDGTRQGGKPGSAGPDGTRQGSKPGSPDPDAAEPGTSEPPYSPSDAVPITEVPPGPAVTGTINLTMPISAHAYLTDRPGEIAGSGPADADTCRTLAQWMARDPATKWCLTLVDPDGRAVAHACAKEAPPTPGTPPAPGTPPPERPPPGTPPPERPPPERPPGPGAPPRPGTPSAPKEPPTQETPPSPSDPPTPPTPSSPGGPPDPAGSPDRDTTTPAPPPGATRAAADLAGRLTDWLTRLRPEYLERDPCTHQRQTLAYRPTRFLRHLITTRNRTCTEPGCNRPAHRCDLDHSIPYDQGGRTCECDLGPLCRHGHQAKQAPGWHLDQPEPGVMIWTMPSGRQYTTRPDPYPT